MSVPNIEARQQSLFAGFDELERLGAYVVGDEGEMLGKISKGLGSDSLGNAYGAGSENKANGLYNDYSKYGSEYSSTSAFNSLASRPPEILVKKDGSTFSVGLLTTNSLARTNGQRINPHVMKAWLKAK